MTHLRWADRPSVNRPIVVAAFEGWNDAGDAATTAIDHLAGLWSATTFADIDPEDFYDFTTTRPLVETTDAGLRVIRWPENEFQIARPPGVPEIILLHGVEPQLRWRTFCDQILTVAVELDARLVITVGALLADVPHTRPTPVFGTAYDPATIEALHLEPSHYEGPTGIVGVLHAECQANGCNSASLWAAVPSYVPAAPSPKAALALVARLTEMLGASLPPDGLADAAVDYEQQISELVREDRDTAEYVAQLEEDHDREGMAAVELIDEVEQYLREQ